MIRARQRVYHRQPEPLAESDKRRDRFRVAPRTGNHDIRVFGAKQPARHLFDALRFRCRGSGDAELRKRRKACGIDRPQRHFGRQAQIDGTRRRTARDLQGSGDDQSGIVLVLKPLIPFHILPQNTVLIVGLLHPDETAAGP